MPPSPPRSSGSIIVDPIIRNIRVSTILVRSTGTSLLLARAKACQQDDEHAEEEEDHGRKDGPHADGVEGVAAGAVGVDVVFDDLWAIVSIV